MKSVQKIRRIGFRKWYERELLQSHLHLVLLLLCSLGMLGSAEAFSARPALSSQLTMLLCAIISAVIGYWALRRYLYLLKHAEFVADQAVCAHCDTYAKWDVTDENADERRFAVCCRKCSHRWSIDI